MKITYCYGRRDRMNSICNSTVVFSTFYAYAQIYYYNTGKLKNHANILYRSRVIVFCIIFKNNRCDKFLRIGIKFKLCKTIIFFGGFLDVS